MKTAISYDYGDMKMLLIKIMGCVMIFTLIVILDLVIGGDEP